ncbi:sugar porter family MFS transporter [Sphingomonas abietis]|uniref:Sugar porter family MFS transporter n=1 Tax=Sphingomonas abietis TaxID=3012344 RepID=A0ABY7NQU1_9SPHN|nr:sugar porter family MFS transporter [Sphingomonas abietis]WBO23175.1 sugar porter family MFS transporter [Sphingomonas abietis]
MRQGVSYNMGFIALISGVATIGGFLFGFDSGVINGTVEGLQQAFHTSSAGTGFNVASVLLGSAAGAFAAGRLADVFGRRSIMIIAAAMFVLSALGAGAATGSAMFVIARMIGGFAVGAASILCPAYISEVTPADTRGRLASIQQIMIIIGLTGAFFSNYLLAKFAGVSTAPLWGGYEAWRWMFWMQTIPSAIFLLALFGIPESPRFLVAKGKRAVALRVLTQLMGPDAGNAKLAEIEGSLSHDHKPRLADLLDENGKVRRIVWVGIGLAVLQQLVGINVVFYYGAVLWQAVGFSEADSLKINILTGTISIAACLVATGLIDRLGRKPLLLIGSIGMTITLALVAFAFSTGGLDAAGKLVLSHDMGILALVSALIYSAMFNFSWGPVMWVMLGEMFPNQIRGAGLAVSGLFQWVANFAITMTFPILLASVGLTGAYALYAFFSLVSILFVIKMVYETKGMELEAMQG